MEKELRFRAKAIMQSEITNVKIRDNNWLKDYTHRIMEAVGLAPDQEASQNPTQSNLSQ